MEDFRFRVTRRAFLGAMGAPLWSSAASAFGQDGAFNPRWLTPAGAEPIGGDREAALSRWSWELVRRTSAPGRLVIKPVTPDEPNLLTEPFVVWTGASEVNALMESEVRGLRRFLDLGGLIFVDDSQPESGAFVNSAKRELKRVLPEVPVTALPEEHVVFKSYYLLGEAAGRYPTLKPMDAMRRGSSVSVLFSEQDLLGALARRGETWALAMETPHPLARQLAVRFAVNVAMFVLCTDYKGDQVHAEELMRRRGRRTP